MLAAGALAACEEDLEPRLREFFSDGFAQDGPGLGERWTAVRYETNASRRDHMAVVSVDPAPKRAIDEERGTSEYLGEPFVVANFDTSDTVVETEVEVSGQAEAGVISHWSYDEAYALLVTDDEVLLCRYTVTDREVFDSARLPGPGWWRLRLEVTPDRITGVASQGEMDRSLAASDADPLPSGRVGITVNALDAQRSAGARFKSFHASSVAQPRQPRPAFAYRFAGGVVPDQQGYKVRLAARTVLPAPVSFEIANDDAFSAPLTADPVAPQGRLGSARTWVGGLDAGREYFWRPVAQDAEGVVRGPSARFSTPPLPGEPVRFAFGSCTSGRIPSCPSFETAASFEPQFYLHAGDWGYANLNSLAHRADHFQSRWIRMLREPNVSKLLDRAPLMFWQDDHDYQADNGWSGTVKEYTVAAFDELHCNPTDAYFDVRWGDAHVFCLDCRLYATDPAAPDDKKKSRLGLEQKEWLKEQMRATDAPLLVVASPMVFRNKTRKDPGWHNVYTHERDELLGFFASLGARVVILSGDAHGHRLIHHFEFGDLFEITASGTDFGDNAAWWQGNFDPEHTVVNVTDRTGFALLELDPAGAGRRVKIRSIATRDGTTMFSKTLPVLR
jgi:hypothetical protein